MIAVVDYGMGNLRSVQKAFEHVGAEAVLTSERATIESADGVLFPGQGCFPDAMRELTRLGLVEVLSDWVRAGRPFLGICLGLQLLFGESEEFGPVKGLDIVAGRVVRFRGPAYESHDGQPGLKVPHIGWNNLRVVKENPVVAELPAHAMAYFVHSYYCVPEDSSWTTIVTDHGVEFTSAVSRGNCFASQFHPEKSGDVGLQMLANFIGLLEGAG